ncbi:MAG: hypothetical protein MJE66_20805 [Proteobacteria bacterium]|nr:hypothetical protein [Pseudomonadota bacterium]
MSTSQLALLGFETLFTGLLLCAAFATGAPPAETLADASFFASWSIP